MVERKLFKTKLCVLYQRGHCSRQSCSFAHGDADLRGFSGSYGGKRNFRDGDLRDKLDRRLSPKRRYSPARYVRDQQISQRYSPLRSIDKKRISFAYLASISWQICWKLIQKPGGILRVGLIYFWIKSWVITISKLHDMPNGSLWMDGPSVRHFLRTSKMFRITSRIKKFVKAHNRCSQIEDELRRSQARLQKSGEQLVLHISGTSGDEENSNVNIVSDGETNHLHTSYPHKVSRGNSSPSKKRLWTNKDTTEGLICEGKALQAETVRLGKRSRWSERPSQSNIDKENGSLKNGNSSAVPLASNEKPRKGKKVSVRTSTTDKLKGARSSLSLPLTSMAAHAVDDVEILEVEEEKVEASALPFLLPPPPPIRQNGYSQYEGNDRNVDVDRVDVI
ncbi:hypothetical protein GOBAR_DD27185 [Gossypium barbadense]|nr:hypothetical protein GOBAR_DD27185 [Gossypium barbadense]